MVPRFCPYKMRVNGDTEWCYISLLARNRVCYFSIRLDRIAYHAEYFHRVFVRN